MEQITVWGTPTRVYKTGNRELKVAVFNAIEFGIVLAFENLGVVRSVLQGIEMV